MSSQRHILIADEEAMLGQERKGTTTGYRLIAGVTAGLAACAFAAVLILKSTSPSATVTADIQSTQELRIDPVHFGTPPCPAGHFHQCPAEWKDPSNAGGYHYSCDMVMNDLAFGFEVGIPCRHGSRSASTTRAAKRFNQHQDAATQTAGHGYYGRGGYYGHGGYYGGNGHYYGHGGYYGGNGHYYGHGGHYYGHGGSYGGSGYYGGHGASYYGGHHYGHYGGSGSFHWSHGSGHWSHGSGHSSHESSHDEHGIPSCGESDARCPAEWKAAGSKGGYHCLHQLTAQTSHKAYLSSGGACRPAGHGPFPENDCHDQCRIRGEVRKLDDKKKGLKLKSQEKTDKVSKKL